MKFVSRFCLIFAVVLFARSSADAHPHAWIDLETTAIFDVQGQFAGLAQTWLFGDFYSGYVLADIGSDDRDVIVEGLRDVARRNILSLQEFNYFTVIEADGQEQAIETVEVFETGVINGRIYLTFETRLTEPVDARAQLIRHAVYDPTYYIEVLYKEGVRPALPTTGAPICSVSLETPTPTFDELAYAASVDQDENNSPTLGKVFAEWTTLRCE